MPSAERTSRRASLAVAIAMVAWVALGASHGVFSGDSGVKLADAHALWSNHYASRSLPYDYDVDPEGRFFPYGDLTRPVGTERQGIYSLVFAGLSAPMLAISVRMGMVLLPILGTLLTIAGMLLIARRLGLEGWVVAVGVAVAVLGTPILFYSGQYAEHTLATGLVTLGIGCLLRRPVAPRRQDVLAGLLVGLGAAVRPEVYCALPLLLIAAIQPGAGIRASATRCAWILGGAFAALIPWWSANLALSGTWDPLVAHNRVHTSSWHNADHMLWGEAAGPMPMIEFGAVAVAILASLAPLSLRVRPIAELVISGLVAGLGCLMLRDSGRTVTGLLTVTPLVAYGILRGPHDAGRELWSIVVGFVLLVVTLDKSGTGGGLQHGARLLMPILPAAILLGAQLAEHRWHSRPRRRSRAMMLACVVPLLAAGTTAQVVGMLRAEKIADGADAAVEAVRMTAPAAVITREPWQSQVLAPLLFRGTSFFYMYGYQRRLLDAIADHGDTQFFLTGEGRTELVLSDGSVATEERRHDGWILLRSMRIHRSR
jgi:hypothetical protein